MDFFSVVSDATPGVPPTNIDPNAVDSFADAIASRFGTRSILTANLAPSLSLQSPVPPLPLPSSPMANMSLAPSSSHSPVFTPVTPENLPNWLDDPTALVVDIRPHAAHASSRLPRALSLSVPSTLLKRPLFSLQRLSAMLHSPTARARFSSWRSASRIIVYDADSSTIPDSSNIQGLLRKFRNDSYHGQLAWLQGGFQAVWRQRRDLVDTNPPSPETETEEDDDHPHQTSFSHQQPTLRTNHLPMSAFSLSSTTASSHQQSRTTPHPSSIPTNFNSAPLSLPHRPAFNPFFDTIRQNVELSHGITDRIPLRLPRRVSRRINDLPFPWLRRIARRAAPSHPRPRNHHPSSSAPPHFHSDDSFSNSDDSEGPDNADIEEGKEALAMQFYRIELAEQRRLMGVMEHHSKESGRFVADGLTCASLTFPFSITAGVEKGAKNRYRHIWPFEHARVRLHQKRGSPADDADDYVNASHVQPLGTTKRYIATQGPLPATFTDFWTLCWEQNVHVIVMLTREVEGATVKCGSYWTDTAYGPLRLRLVSTSHEGARESPKNTFGGFFAPTPAPAPTRRARKHMRKAEMIKRVFELRHTDYPAAGVRSVVHFQYLEWPDMNVPDDPRGVLGLIREVERAVEETGAGVAMGESVSGDGGMDGATGIARHAMTGRCPVLLHCSAGVGRTGGFIAVDAVLDAVRREMRMRKAGGGEEMNMDVGTAPMTEGGGGTRRDDGDDVAHVADLNPSDVDGMITPMQIDNRGTGTGTSSNKTKAFRPCTSTRKWAESVLDQTGAGLDVIPSSGNGGNSTPTPPSSSSVASSSAFPSSLGSVSASSVSGYSGSEDFFGNRPYHGGMSSSIGTSISGGSVSNKAFQPRSSFLRHADSGEASTDAEPTRKSESLPVPVPGPLPAFGRTESEHRDRMHAFSAPISVAAAKSTSAVSKPGIGIGSSPLANVSTPWLAGDDRKFSSPLPGAEHLATVTRHPSSISGEGAGGGEVGQSRGTQPRPMLSPSKWSPPLNSTSLPVSRTTSDGLVNSPFRATTVDYKEPRALHRMDSPLALSTYEEPIWEVVQDMREQRMSLCQSLRQYVFVHAAVIEGALMIVDEERAAGASEGGDASLDAKGGGGGVDALVPVGGGVGGSQSAATPNRPVMSLHTSDSSTTSSTGKRGASPTELLKEGMRGEVLLSKRPSIKGKQQSGERAAGAFHAASLLSLVTNPPVPPIPPFPKTQ